MLKKCLYVVFVVLISLNSLMAQEDYNAHLTQKELLQIKSTLDHLKNNNRPIDMPYNIGLVDEALKIVSNKPLPILLAMLKLELGNCLSKNELGDRKDNLKQAISTYEAALKIFTRQRYPADWAATQNSIGICWKKMPGGDAVNYENAINHFNLAIEVGLLESNPDILTAIQVNLANTYRLRINGDKSENLERSIEYLNNVLEIQTKDKSPKSWATTISQLGIAYAVRVKGNRSDNIEMAIEYFKSRLEVISEETAPFQWVKTHSNLGHAYLDRKKGDYGQNIEEAIKHCNIAINVASRNGFQSEWEYADMGLRNAYKLKQANEIEQNNEPEQEIDEARRFFRNGFPARAISLLRGIVQKARDAHDSYHQALALEYLSKIYQDLGAETESINSLKEALTVARGTVLEVPIESAYYLSIAEQQYREGEYFKSLSTVIDVRDNHIPFIKTELSRLSYESSVFTQQIYLYLAVAEILKDLSPEIRASELAYNYPSIMKFLVTAFENTNFKKLLAKSELSKDILLSRLLVRLDEQRPWYHHLYQMALELNEKVTSLDKTFKGEMKNIQVGMDISQRANIYHGMGDIDEAIAYKKQALEMFQRENIFLDQILVLDELVDLYLKKGNDIKNDLSQSQTRLYTDAAVYSRQLIKNIERQTYALMGNTMDPLLLRFSRAYNRHYDLLLNLYQLYKNGNNPNFEAVLDLLLLQVDRINFRPHRRDLAVYSQLMEQIKLHPDLLARIIVKREIITDKQNAVDKATFSGKRVEDYLLSDLKIAKKNLMKVIADFAMSKMDRNGTVLDPPVTMDYVRAGLTNKDAIILYIKQEKPNVGLRAAVIRKQSPVHLTEVLLKDIPLELVSRNQALQKSITLESPDINNHLKEIAKKILHPLGDLPENLIIIPIPEMIGIPFEALPMKTGKLLIAKHTVRYSFGFTAEINNPEMNHSYKKAYVIGAEKFEKRNLSPLPASKNEIEKIRSFLKTQNIKVEPDNALPQYGSLLFSKDKHYDVIHISTHSQLDDQLPTFDVLVFPQDDLFAYELALSPLKADLVVLSACELFSYRKDRVYPISGLTTAMMAHISPRVISTLWPVNASATQVFMQRFYQALIEVKDPAKALAITKRDFLKPEMLKQWFETQKIPLEKSTKLELFKHPYFWAPFVLTAVGST